MGKKPKKVAYVVFRGREPGVYLTWDECNAQVDGFTDNKQKGYFTVHEAETAWKSWCSREEAGPPRNLPCRTEHLQEIANNSQGEAAFTTVMIKVTNSQ